MLKTFVVSAIITVMLTVAASAGITVSQSLSKSQVAFEDSVRFKIKLIWDGSQVAYRFPKPLSPEIDKMRVRGFVSSVATAGSGEDEVTTKTFQYTLIPKSSGLGYISPVTIENVTWPDSIPGELVTEALTVQIAEPQPKIEDEGSSTSWLIGLIVVIVLGGAGAAWWFMKRNRPTEPDLRPGDKFLADLSLARQNSGNDLKRFQDSLCRILSEYLVSVTGLSPDGIGDEKLADELTEKGMNAAEAEKLAGWFTRARLDKYRPVKAEPGEVIRLEAEIRAWFEKKS